MKQIIAYLFLQLSVFFASGQTIYSKAFGSEKAEPFIFIHGGPIGNSILFEATTDLY